MYNYLRDIPLFTAVARHKSFTRAAQELNVPVSSLSRRIATLERTLGLLLLNRAYKSVELTEAGKLYFTRCQFIMTEIQSARDTLTSTLLIPQGIVRLTVPNEFSNSHFAKLLIEFSRLYPAIHLDVTFTDRFVDLLTEPYDLSIHVDTPPSSLPTIRKLFSIQSNLYASPELLKKIPAVSTPADLHHVPCLNLQQIGTTWELHQNNTMQPVTINPIHSFSSMRVLVEFALAGMGVAPLINIMTPDLVANNALMPILPEWSFKQHPIYLVMARPELTARVRLLADYLRATCTDTSKQDLGTDTP